VEAKNAADAHSFYESAKDISKNLSKKLASMETYLDDALASMTVVFNTDRYTFIHSAYQMLGKTQVNIGVIHGYFSCFRVPHKN
jgi:hypothetical protein